MNFLARFKSDASDGLEEELPPRRRTFSAAQYREEELARAAEARAAQAEADAEAQAAAEAAREARVEGAGDEEPESSEPAVPPMDWEEAVGWLSTRSPEARSLGLRLLLLGAGLRGARQLFLAELGGGEGAAARRQLFLEPVRRVRLES